MIAEVSRELKHSLRDILPEQMIDRILSRLPEDVDEHIGLMLAEMVRKMPAELPPEQKLEAVLREMSNKAREHEAQDGKHPGNTRAITRDYFDSLLIELRLMGQTEPKLETEIFGRQFRSPVMTAALSHLSRFVPGEYGKMEQLLLGAKQEGCLAWVGMMENEAFSQCVSTGADLVRIVKPYADEEKIFSQLRQSETLGALAVGMDIDHSLTVYGEEDVAIGQAMERKSVEQLRRYVEATGLPFVFKGVLSVRDALIAKEIGASGIVLSHHGGRMTYTVPPLLLLPEIRKAVGEDLTIFVDCGLASGMDVYKAMALGADAAGVGTHLLPILNREGAEGVAKRLEAMRAELKGVMAHTGITDTKSFDASVLHRRVW